MLLNMNWLTETIPGLSIFQKIPSKRFGQSRKKHIPFTDSEMELLWKYVEDKRCVDVLLIQCYSGWRPQELGLIELKDVDLENWIFRGGMKTDAGEDRAVPIHSRIKHLVERRYKEAKELGSEYLFNYIDQDSNRKNIKLTYSRYQKAFERIRDELKLNRIIDPTTEGSIL